VWAIGGAVALVACGLVPWLAAVGAMRRGLDVCLFLAGMMLLAETARGEGLFDRVAVLAVQHSRGSPGRLFALVYAVGVAVTAVLSNDATAVVLTPAVFSAARAAKVDPLPHLFACAFVANAASFVLPISNPANIVLYADHVPPLGPWLRAFVLPSALAIGATFVLLRLLLRRRLAGDAAAAVARPAMTPGACAALAGIAITAPVLLAASAFGVGLGGPTLAMGAATAMAACILGRASPRRILTAISWQVLALVAGLFVLVEGLARAGVVGRLAALIRVAAAGGGRGAAWIAALLVAGASNLINNLPAGLVASSAIARAHPPATVTDALLIGVDLGPNLSVTGSLATILWLSAVRREGQQVSALSFLKLGALVTPPALLLALAGRLLAPQ
jgi:arsenical pump membrane protein